MSTSRSETVTLALIGEGPVLTALLGVLEERPRTSSVRIGAVVDVGGDADSSALKMAEGLGVPCIGRSLDDLAGKCAPDLVFLFTEEERWIARLRDILPAGTPLLSGATDRLLRSVGIVAGELRALQADSHRLKETRLRLNKFVETASLAIYVKDRDLRYRRVNSHALALLGRRSADLVGSTNRTLFPDGGARWLEMVERETITTRKTLHASGVLPVKGRDKHVQVTLFPVIENGEVEGLYALLDDTTDLVVSERKLHEKDEQLSETRTYLREVLENSRDLIFLIDPRGELLSINSGAEHTLGYSRDEVVGTPAARLCATPGVMDELIAVALHDGHSASYEVEFRSKDNRKVLCNMSLTLIEGPDGKPLELVSIGRDITTRIKLKNDLIRSERLAAVGQMASGVAHEINNPLAVIDTIAGLVEETLADEGDKLQEATRSILERAMERLHHQVQRCTNITHSLLGFVRKSETGMVPIDLDALLDECLNVLGTELRRSQTRVDRHFSPHLPKFESDPMLLEQVFVNLIANAIDAMEAVPDRPSRLEIITCRDGDDLTVTVEDNGIGIKEEDRERVFDLFHTTKPVGQGTGLGLSIVHDILFRLGGSVRVASEEGRWTRFVVSLPLTPPDAPRPDPSSLRG